MKVKSKRHVNEHAENETCNPHLMPHKIYNVVGFSDKSYRLLNDIGEPILYPKSLFDVIDPDYPSDWLREDFDDGEYFVDPPEFAIRGFYEDYFDGVADTVEKFEAYRKLHGL